jgi:hypothetical protein
MKTRCVIFCFAWFLALSLANRVSADWIVPTNAVASSEQGSDVATNTIDGSGLSEESTNGLHAAGSYSWSMEQGGEGILVQDEYITFDLGDNYRLTNVHIWQFTRTSVANDANRGVKQFDILVSRDNVNFTELVADATLNRCLDADANNTPDGNEPVQTKPLLASGVRYVRFGIDLTYENNGTKDWQGGFGEVRFEGTVIQPGTVVVVR